ncbi:MAG: hypothetical protein A2284_05650 [Deltaproteobacteria bacterium RIFOXYA12_FULL_61_11]|nr:MAG: hypothetical protein A2284_05650 [Deltaproteobacteria bacterium RIFOXYA12_FULL_61_11]
MHVTTLDTIFGALNAAGVRYLVAGGLAVNAHGYLRLTCDLDLVITLDRGNIQAFFAALVGIGYRPRVPIEARQFAEPTQRATWREEKGMQVLSFYCEQHRDTAIDVFIEEPFDFSTEYTRAMRGALLPGLEVPFVALETLIRMKEAADRPKDRDDVVHLRWILEQRQSHE